MVKWLKRLRGTRRPEIWESPLESKIRAIDAINTLILAKLDKVLKNQKEILKRLK